VGIHYSMSIHIHDFQCANKMSVNEFHWLLGCAVCAVSRCIGGTYCSIFWVAKVRPLGGTTMQPQLGMFITRPSSFKIDAKEFLSTNGTIYRQCSNPHLHNVQWQPYALQIKQIRTLPGVIPSMFLHSYTYLPRHLQLSAICMNVSVKCHFSGDF